MLLMVVAVPDRGLKGIELGWLEVLGAGTEGAAACVGACAVAADVVGVAAAVSGT